MARPAKYTPERREAILAGLRAGLTRTAACARVDVHVTQLERWCERFASFATEVAHAEAEAESQYTAIIAQAARPHDVTETTTTTGPNGELVKTVVRREFDWRAALEWLKRRRRDEWGDSIDVRKLPDDTVVRLLNAAAGGGGAEAGPADTGRAPAEDSPA